MIRDSYIYLIYKIIPSIFNLLTLMVFTRLLTKHDYGFYSIIITIVIFFNGVLFQWIRISTIRLYERNKSSIKDFMNSVNTLLIVIYICLVTITFLVIVALNILNYVGKEIYLYWIIIVLFTIIQSTYDLYLNLQRARLKPRLYGVYNIIQSVLSFTISVSLYLMFEDILYLLIGVIVGYLIPAIIMIVKEENKYRFLLNSDYNKELLKYGLPLILTLSINLIIHTTDRFMLMYFSGTIEVAEYTATYNITQQTILFAMSILNLAAFPRIIKKYENANNIETKKEMLHYFKIFFVLMIPALLGVVVLSEEIVLLLIGDAYQGVGQYLLPVLLVSVFLQGTKLYYFDMSFHISGKTKLQSYSVILGLILNIVLNYILIPTYGPMGAAIATLCSSLFSLLIGIILSRNSFPVPFDYQIIFKIVIATSIMTFIVSNILKDTSFISLIMRILIGVVVYFIVMIALEYKSFRKFINNKRGSKP